MELTLQYRLTILYVSIGIIFLGACNRSGEQQISGLPKKVDFNFHIKPILSDRCFACHGPDKNKREASLRLDTPEGALEKELESGNLAFVPGDIARSEALQRMLSDDPNEQMPPPESNLSLSEREIALIQKWIDQGAEYKTHWAFIPPQKSVIPEISNPDWASNPIDYFVMAKLDESGKTPNAPATKEVLLRRLYLDLTGLPPSPEEIDEFLADDSPDAYEKVVDRLLASPHFGERMAISWLDAARYTDSHGYSQDGYREMYPWREWVINSFNQNMPFDNFIVWQMAGDKLHNPTKEQKLATGFLRNHRINTEGGIVFEEYRVENVADRTHTTATTFLGLTYECARCHDHKYDPISQKEYYQLFSFFNQVNEEGLGRVDGNSGPEILLPDEEVEAKMAWLEKKIDDHKKQLSEYTQNLSLSLPEISPQDINQGLIMHLDAEATFLIRKNGSISGIKDLASEYVYPVGGSPELIVKDQRKALKLDGYNMIINNELNVDFEQSETFSIAFWLQAYPETEFMEIVDRINVKYGLENGYDITITEGKLTFRLAHSLPANLIEVRSREPLPRDQWTHIGITYDGMGKAKGFKIYFDGEEVPVQIVFDQLTETTKHPRRMTLGGTMHLDENVDDGHFFMDDFRIYNQQISPTIVKYLAGRSDITPTKQEKLTHFLVYKDEQYQSIVNQMLSLREKLIRIQDSLTSTMVMEELEKYRPTYILDRGAYDSPTEEVYPSTPESILAFSEDLPQNRLGLAYWLIDPQNPLTSRVIVNRFWQQLFGTGIVETVEDFGSQGDLPSHPLLLDWLAITFMESGWDVKAIIKTMVMSSSYRQSSKVTLEDRKEDPNNRWLARGPSYRLPAEIIRDNALAASGLLNPKIGGPSVKPYQPKGLWSESSTFSKALRTYEQDHGANLYRRSLYTFWRRTIHHPVMAVFDAPNRDHCIVRRQRTNTPLQALTLLNETQFVEASRVLAERVTKEEAALRDQIGLAYRLLTGLTIDEKALQLLEQLYIQEKERFEQQPGAANELLSQGEYPVDRSLEMSHLASLTVICNAMLNFDETVTKR